ncbi:hypothetical protein FUSO6_11645 [Fusobacterium necrophorum DAB]|nr:hypothetical protein FUSO6_11645 [Fusobacterium necrophorum DAB]
MDIEKRLKKLAELELPIILLQIKIELSMFIII